MKSKPGKEGRVVREPAPAAAAERQRLVRDARCARVSSASSAPTPAPRGAFPLVRHQCHHQFAPPGASPGVNWRGPAQAYIVTTPVRCSLTDCQSQFAPDPCHAPVTRGPIELQPPPQLKSWKPARAQISKRGHWTGKTRAIPEQVRHQTIRKWKWRKQL